MKKTPRHLSRSLAVQAIYYYKLNNTEIIEIEKFLNDNNKTVYDQAQYHLMHILIENGIKNFDEYLNLYTEYTTRTIDDINLIEQIILVISAYELTSNLEAPAVVIINEAIELSKFYGAHESYKFINSLVEQLAHQTRNNEITLYKKQKSQNN